MESDQKAASQQTEVLQFQDSECSPFQLEDKYTQTAINLDEIHPAKYDQQRLAEFLQKSVPIVLEALEKNVRSQAFSHYEQLSHGNQNDGIAKLHVLKCDDSFANLSCTGLSWNATGSVIGVVYGCLEHEGWCDHTSRIACWNIYRRNFEPTKPNTCLEVSICLSYIDFHPTKPAVFVTGNYNGQISLWNLGYGDDPEVAKTETHDKGHNDVITCLTWIKDGISDRYQICSSSVDGKILVWKYSERRKQLQLEKGYIILAEDLPSNVLLKKKSSGEIGVTSMSFFSDHITFIVAIEGGVIVLCSLESNKLATGQMLDGVSLRSPVIDAISSPIPYISHVICSPLMDLFALCGPYNGLYVYNAKKMKDEPLTLFNTNELAAVCWYPANPSVIGLLAKGNLQLFNAKTGGILHETCLPETGRSMSIMKFNNNDPKLVSVGDCTGNVHIWQLKTNHPNI